MQTCEYTYIHTVTQTDIHSAHTNRWIKFKAGDAGNFEKSQKGNRRGEDRRLVSMQIREGGDNGAFLLAEVLDAHFE